MGKTKMGDEMCNKILRTLLTYLLFNYIVILSNKSLSNSTYWIYGNMWKYNSFVMSNKYFNT